jgi:hypothetical protein
MQLDPTVQAFRTPFGAFGLGVDYPILLPAKIDAVTTEDLQRIGQIYFLRGQFAWAPYAVCETRPGGW